jgi:cell division protein ZapA
MGELLSVKVSIGNRTYPLRITREEHERVTQAAELINKRMKEFEELYAVKDKQDLLAMCALQFANESMGHHTAAAPSGKDEVGDRIEYLTLLVDEYLSQEAPSQ